MNPIKAKKSHKIFISIVLILIGIGTTINISLFAQSTIMGCILNQQDSLPVVGAHLIINGTVRAASHAPDGSFSLKVKNASKTYITISHIAFYQTTIAIKQPNQKINIYLQRKEMQLPQVEISAMPQRNLIKDKKIYVIDYAFEGNAILLLSYINQKQNQAALIIINDKGDTLKSCSLKKPDYLYSDCFRINHLIDKEMASQIFVDSSDIKLLYQVKKDSFLQSFNSIIGYYNHRYYLRGNEASNQVVKLYVFDSRDTSLRELTTIVDEGGLERLSDKGRLQSGKDYSAADARFEEMCFYNPKVVPMFVKHDSILIFNTINNILEIYNDSGILVNKVDFDFNESIHWDKKIIQDPTTGKIFTQFTRRGVTSLAEVNLQTGKLGVSTKIPGMNFVQKIAINNNKIYFLYNDDSNYSYKQIYSMNLSH